MSTCKNCYHFNLRHNFLGTNGSLRALEIPQDIHEQRRCSTKQVARMQKKPMAGGSNTDSISSFVALVESHNHNICPSWSVFCDAPLPLPRFLDRGKKRGYSGSWLSRPNLPSARVQGSAKRRGLGYFNSLPGSAWL